MNPLQDVKQANSNNLLFRTTKALLKVGYECNNSCLFCHSSPHRGLESSTRDILAKIDACASTGVDTVVFSGGEPTIRKDLFDLAFGVKNTGKSMGLITNGRMLSYRSFRKSLFSTPLSYVQVSLGGAVESTHDLMVQVPGAFRQTLNGLKGLLYEMQDSPLAVTVNVVVTGRTSAELDAAALLMLDLAKPVSKRIEQKRLGFRLKLSAVEPEGAALLHPDTLAADPEFTAPACRKFFRTWSSTLASSGIGIGFEGYPLCLMAPHESRIMDLWTDRFIYMSEAFEKKLHFIDDKHKTRFPACHSCSFDDCPGLYRTGKQCYGPQEPMPVKYRKSNSFIFEAKAVFETVFHTTDCPVLKGEIPKPDPRAELFTSEKGKCVLWRTSTRDFGPRVIHKVKNQWEQIYELPENPESVTGRGFFKSLVKLQIAVMCNNCPSSDTCGKIFVPSDKNAITEEESRIKEMVSGLKGLWLDVGCGSMPYGSTEKAGLSILGIDPEMGSFISMPRPSVKGGVLEWTGFRGVAEALPFWNNVFDGVLCIRSLPHFADPLKAAEEALRVLKPGGKLVLFSDVIFGICRNADHATPDEDKKYLHYRNPGPEELIDLMQNAGFETKKIRTPGPLTSNLVFISAKKPDSH